MGDHGQRRPFRKRSRRWRDRVQLPIWVHRGGRQSSKRMLFKILNKVRRTYFIQLCCPWTRLCFSFRLFVLSLSIPYESLTYRIRGSESSVSGWSRHDKTIPSKWSIMLVLSYSFHSKKGLSLHPCPKLKV